MTKTNVLSDKALLRLKNPPRDAKIRRENSKTKERKKHRSPNPGTSDKDP